jgi:hypothetical protein
MEISRKQIRYIILTHNKDENVLNDHSDPDLGNINSIISSTVQPNPEHLRRLQQGYLREGGILPAVRKSFQKEEGTRGRRCLSVGIHRPQNALWTFMHQWTV